MTPKQINDLKKEHNAMQEQGQDLYAKVMDLHDKCLDLQGRIQEAEGTDYDPIPLIFGAGFRLDPDLCQAAEADRIANESKHIIKRADEAKLTPVMEMFQSELEHFAKLVAAAEREECAKLCEAYVAPGIGKEMATAIRARGSK